MKKYLLLFICIFLYGTMSFAQLSVGQIMHLPLNGNTNDVSGLNNDGMVQNAISVPDPNGNPNGALFLNGTDPIVLPNNASLKPPLPITLSVFVKLDNLNGPMALYHSDVIVNNYAGFFVNITTSGQIMAHIGGMNGTNAPGNRRSYLSHSTLSVGVWHHVAIVINAYNDMKIYIDCQESTGTYSGSGSTSIVYSSFQGGVGEGGGTPNYPQGYFLEGSLDEVRLWGRALAASEVLQLCEGGPYTILAPNPSNKGSFNIEIDAVEVTKNTFYVMSDMSGRVVVRNKMISNKVEVSTSQLESGLYNVQIYRNDVLISTSRLMIEK